METDYKVLARALVMRLVMAFLVLHILGESFVALIKVLFTNISSCVSNNGHTLNILP